MGPGAIIVDEPMLTFLTELEVQKALRLQYPVSLVVLAAEPADRRPVLDPARLAQRLAEVLSSVMRRTDSVAPSPSSVLVQILLVDSNEGNVAGIAERLRHELGRHQFDLDGEVAGVVPRMGSACFPSTAATAAELRAQAAMRAASDSGSEA